MADKYRRNFLKDKEAKILLIQTADRLKANVERLLTSKPDVELIETRFAKIFLINGKPLLARTEEGLFPTLVFSEFFALAPKVVVDMGAIPYVCKGANVMRPGIRCFNGEFRKGDLVFIVDEKHGKPLAVGEILYDKSEANEVKQGIVVKNIHFVGDKIWNFIKKT
jgi:PUA domain protein